VSPRKHLIACLTAALLIFNSPGATLYVNVNGDDPSPPYDSWSKAARTIQDAIGAAAAGDTILVTNGVYTTGAYDVYGPSRVAITNAVTVRSVNGPAVTTIQGYQVPGVTNGPGAVRCAFVGSGATLSGFTLTGGGTTNGTVFWAGGGGAYCQSATASISNCIVSGNAAAMAGGGVVKGTVDNCLLIGNTSFGGTIDGGGGASGALLRNCLLTGNWAVQGGGSAGGSLINCTVSGNSASGSAGGTSRSALYNCIVYYNTAPNAPNYTEPLTFMGLAHCCTTPIPTAGSGHFTNPPQFLDPSAGDFRLQTNSPCINAGDNGYMTSHLDFHGAPRISGFTVDVGACELQNPASLLSYVWAQSYGFPTDGSGDNADGDDDGMNNWHEWRCGTLPNDPLSLLKLAVPTGDASGITLRWSSVFARKYYVECSTNLNTEPAFFLRTTNFPGHPGATTTWKDIRATNAGPYFYRIGVH